MRETRAHRCFNNPNDGDVLTSTARLVAHRHRPRVRPLRRVGWSSSPFASIRVRSLADADRRGGGKYPPLRFSLLCVSVSRRRRGTDAFAMTDGRRRCVARRARLFHSTFSPRGFSPLDQLRAETECGTPTRRRTPTGESDDDRGLRKQALAVDGEPDGPPDRPWMDSSTFVASRSRRNRRRTSCDDELDLSAFEAGGGGFFDARGRGD